MPLPAPPPARNYGTDIPPPSSAASPQRHSDAERLLFALFAFVALVSLLFLLRLILHHFRRRSRPHPTRRPSLRRLLSALLRRRRAASYARARNPHLPPPHPFSLYVPPAPPPCAGAARAAVDRACPPETLRKPLADPTCPVCLDALLPGARVRTLPCAHVFHDQCAADWLVKMNVCPVCRTPPVELPPDATAYAFDVYGDGDVSAHSGLRALSDRVAAQEAAAAAAAAAAAPTGFAALQHCRLRGRPTR